jgi:hypothetical protein
MKNFRIFDRENLEKILSLSLISFVLMSFSGCTTSYELAPKEELDVMSRDENSDFLTAGLIQKLEIPGENFKLVTEYTGKSDSEKLWRVTANKTLYLKIYTENLPNDTKVYIDNIHVDTSIKSELAAMDGIQQDTMDDRVHNALMMGFPVGNDICYYGAVAIEGTNDKFISGTFYGYNGIESGTLKQERYTELDYRKNFRVTHNRIHIVYDLLIKAPKDEIPRNVSVETEFLVPISKEPIEIEEVNDITGSKKIKRYTE